MQTFLWIALFVTVFLLVFMKRLILFAKRRKRLIDLVDKLPGPRAIPIFGCAYQFKWNNLDFSYQLDAWGKQYSSNGLFRFWIGPIPMILLTKPESAKVILDSTQLLSKASDYDILKPWLGTGLLLSDGNKWRTRRKMLTPAFHFQILSSFIETHAKEAQILVDQLASHVDTNYSFDIYPYLKRCALDIICETAMGTKVSAQTNRHSNYVKSVQKVSGLAWKYVRLPWMRLSLIWYLSGNGFVYNAHLKLLTDFTRKVISSRCEHLNVPKGQTGQRRAFLDLLLEMRNDNKLTDEDIREEVDTFMFEGHDTTSSAMGWALWLFGHFPLVQQGIFAELDEIYGHSNRETTEQDLKRMKYLERCIKEVLRLLPPVPLFARIVSEDTVINQYTIPKGATVVIVPGCIHRDPQLYPNPDEFNPDNFLPENVANRSPFSFIPFSAGQRNCIGVKMGHFSVVISQKFAMMEEKTVLSTILRRYSLESSQNQDQCRPLPELILKPSDGFRIKLFSRFR